jgi:hypothetical protein
VNLTGILFARPETALAKAEIIPQIDYWHHRSDNHTDFFCGGFGAYGNQPDSEKPEDADPLPDIRHDKWWYSPIAFTQFVNEIESLSTWNYSGGADLIITNARYNRDQNTAMLDFTSAMVVDLESAKKDEAILTVPHLVELIFRFAKQINEDMQNPAWVCSDKKGFLVLRSSLKDLLLSFLPTALQPAARRAFHFKVSDISNRNK